MKVSILVLSLFASVQMALAQPRQVILLRHAEKSANESDVHPSKQCKARAMMSLLTTNIILPVFH